MSELQEQFQKASKEVLMLSEPPDNETKLRLYALYKQGTQGNCEGPRPGMIDFIGRAKYDSWKKLEGMSQGSAMQAYIDLVDELLHREGRIVTQE